jgi:hypothetical protein
MEKLAGTVVLPLKSIGRAWNLQSRGPWFDPPVRRNISVTLILDISPVIRKSIGNKEGHIQVSLKKSSFVFHIYYQTIT